MKTIHFNRGIAMALGLVAFSVTGWSGIAPGQVFISMVVTPSAEIEASDWADIKDFTFDTRVKFFSGLAKLEIKVQRQVTELTAKRATMAPTTDTKEWDFAMKEMNNAQAYLKSMGEELGQATKETWDQQKDKVGQAWVRTQEAYAKVKASTTS